MADYLATHWPALKDGIAQVRHHAGVAPWVFDLRILDMVIWMRDRNPC